MERKTTSKKEKKQTESQKKGPVIHPTRKTDESRKVDEPQKLKTVETVRLDTSNLDNKEEISKLKVSEESQVNFEEEFSDVVKEIRDQIKYRTADDIAIIDVMLLVTRVMTLLKQFRHLSGLEKRAVGVKVIQRVVRELGDTSPEVETFLKTALPDTIDMAYYISKHHLNFKSKKSFSCFSS